MEHFTYKDTSLYAQDCAIADLAKTYGTPLYIYCRATIERHWHAMNNAASGHKHLICYAVKANSNLAVLNLLARLGSGFDIVSKGELMRVLKAGGDASKVVFSGVGKKSDEIAFALAQGIYCFNVESTAELERIQQVASDMGAVAPVALRVNPDVDASTHPYISTGLKENKFGIGMDDIDAAFARANALPNLAVKGIDCHIGSQITELSPFLDSMDRILLLVDALANKGIHLSHIDVGGGLGVRYTDESPPLPDQYARAIANKLAGRKLTLIYEPGRVIMANAGIFVTQVEWLKTNEGSHFAIVDGAMNDLIRPALYQAWQEIIPVEKHDDRKEQLYDVVGPVCETGDFLGKQRKLAIAAGDLLAVRSSGAYGFTMSSNYNSRPRVVEIMVDGATAHVIRARETFEQLWQGESLLPD